MTMQLPATLSELLHFRALDPHGSSAIHFIDDDTNLPYKRLFADSLLYAQRLRAVGLGPSDIVLSSFPDHRSHVELFWACCLAGVAFCPLPAPHPDASRREALLTHLQNLLRKPMLIGSPESVAEAKRLLPGLSAVDIHDLPPPSSQHAASIFPSAYPSPSDIVCLMLTSGSTGNQKAVALTHSNLLSSVRGKVRCHGTTSGSRFLNWIAFDHVACLSEIHLHALYTNSDQWLVSPTTVVRNPGSLLEYTCQYGITYTFSPNFLLASILQSPPVTQLDLSALRAFISGGEAVPSTTAIAFANLLERHSAPRDALRAGFGMSETGAGCIYDTRQMPTTREGCSNRDYLSLGKCCGGVELRIIDQESGLEVESGQSGLLQLRGPSVFKCYFGDPQSTEASFTLDGWFVTGDLAQLDDDGHLYLVGRQKDCININGVKYSPGEAIRHLEDAAIPGIRYPIVFVCPLRLPGAATESYAVFYQRVVEHASVDQIANTSRAIKSACSLFFCSPPHTVVPLPSEAFVRSTLGKVSSAQIVKAYLQGAYRDLEAGIQCEDMHEADLAVEADRSETVANAVAQAIQEAFGFPKSSVRRSQSILELGASSMHVIRFKHILQEQLGVADIPTIAILQRPTIGDLISYLETFSICSSPSTCHRYRPLVRLSATGSKPPLFLIHPGVGEILVFMNLARLLSKYDDRPVYALRARGFEADEEPFTTFAEMVNCYTEAIMGCWSSGPYYIAGYSLGGAIAFEIARSLEARGLLVEWVGIMNLPPYIQERLHELDGREVLLNLTMFLGLITGKGVEELRDRIFEDDHWGAPGALNEAIDSVFRFGDQERLEELNLDREAFARWVQVAYAINRTGRSYAPSGHLRSRTTVFCAVPLPSMGTRQEYKQNRLSKWREFISEDRLGMIDVEGEHYTMLGDHYVESFARHLMAALR